MEILVLQVTGDGPIYEFTCRRVLMPFFESTMRAIIEIRRNFTLIAVKIQKISPQHIENRLASCRSDTDADIGAQRARVKELYMAV